MKAVKSAKATYPMHPLADKSAINAINNYKVLVNSYREMTSTYIL